MSRSQGPQQTGQWPPQAAPTEQEIAAWQAQQAAQSRRPPQPVFQQPAPAPLPDSYAQQTQYHYPPQYQQAPQAAAQPAYVPPPQHNHAQPQFDAYVPPSQPRTAPPQQSYTSPAYDQLSHLGQRPPSPAPVAVPDFGPYTPAPDPRLDLRGPLYDQAQQWQMAQPPPAAYNHGPDVYAQQQTPVQDNHYDLNGYAAPAAPLALEAQPTNQLEVADEHEDAGEYEEEPRRGRTWLIAAALTGAIVVGGGMAYGYKSYFSGKSQVATPVIKGDPGPAKVKPSEPGGKQFSHTDSKIMGKLGENGPTAVSASGGDADGGARKVATLSIGRDGTISAPPAPVQPPSAIGAVATPVGTTVSVPGVMMVDGIGGRQTSQQALAPTSAQPVVVAPPAPAATPPPPQKVAVATVKPTAGTPPPPVAEKAAPVPPAAAKVAVPKKIEKPAAVAAAVTKPTGAGYMAVLASVPATDKSRMDALKQFADLQQKYGSALAGRTPDVQEANLGEKGTYHRLLAGPPGSREQASALCTQLKAAGYASCWVTAY